MRWTSRHYRAGDEARIVQLWQQSFAAYGGFIPRTIEFWTQNVLQRPGISEADIILTERRRRVHAFSVLGPNGAVLEFAVDATLPPRQRKRACLAMLAALEDRARKRGDDALRILAPSADHVIDRALLSADYLSAPNESMAVGILNTKRLIELLLDRKSSDRTRHRTLSFLLEIVPGDYRVSPYDRLRIQFSDGQVRVEDQTSTREAADSEVRIETDLCTLTELIFNEISFADAIRSQRIRIADAMAHNDAEWLFSRMTIDTPMFSPASDMF